jgi:DNA-binding winged helix-turn-helix (wHTH) protein
MRFGDRDVLGHHRQPSGGDGARPFCATLRRHARILGALLKSPGEALTKAQLMDAAWPGMAIEESNLSVQIASLRRALGPAPDGGDWIVTVPRVGYRLVVQRKPATIPVSHDPAGPPR